jgi:rhodanese-related sulfurtransferase
MQQNHQSQGAARAATASAPNQLLTGGVLSQILAVVGLGTVLGFTFNSASPLGIRFGTTPVAPVAASAPPEVSVPPAAALPPENVLAPAVPPQPQVVQVTEQISVAPLPPAPATVFPAPNRPVPVPPIQSVAAVTPPAAELNPAPTHWPEVKAWMAEGRAVVVDVRHTPLFQAGHIPGAISLPEISPPEAFRSFLDQQPTNLIVVVYCSSTSCSQSARVANRLVNEFKWPKVRYMTGGYQEYQQAELAKPAATTPAQP